MGKDMNNYEKNWMLILFLQGICGLKGDDKWVNPNIVGNLSGV